MLNKIHMVKISALLLIVVMATVACGGGGLTVEQSVALTVAASNVQPTLSVDQIVAMTVAAAAPVAPAGPDIADPNSGIQPIQPVADPNLASGTPQLRANLNSNVRNGPGTNYRVISSLLAGSVVTVIAKNGDGTWFLIELPGGSTGWIADSVTDPVNAADMGKVGFAATIPAPPPPPPATATATKAATTVATATATAAVTATPVVVTATPTHTPVPVVPSTISITTINNNPTTVCFLFIALSTDPTWGNDWLGTNTMPTGNQITNSFPTGTYDFLAEDCGNNTIATQSNVTITSNHTWMIP
jgi:hypothetical protein